MNIGKLVREKMKALREDHSGEYIDNTGKHMAVKASGDGYTVSYGGDAKREMNISREQASKLAGACRKLDLASDKKDDDQKDLKKKRLAKFSVGQTVTWIDKPDGTLAKAKVIEVKPKGSSGMGMGAKPIDQDIFVLKLLESHPNGNRFRAGEEVFATVNEIK